MNICILSNFYKPLVASGIGSYHQDIIAGLTALGHRVHVVTTGESEYSCEQESDSVWVHRCYAESRLGLSMKWAEIVADLHAAGEIDVVETPEVNFAGLHLCMANLYASPSQRIPVVVFYHTPNYVTHYYNCEGIEACEPQSEFEFFELVVAALASGRICPSGLLADEMSAMLPGSPPTVIPLPLWKQPFERRPGTSADRPMLLYAGRQNLVKGLDIFVLAANRLWRDMPELQVVLVGADQPSGPGRPSTASFLQALADPPRGDSFTILPKQPRHEWISLLNNASLFCVPSRFDNFPVVTLEAMSSGVPTVLSTRNGVTEVMPEEVKRKAVFTSGDYVDMSETVRRLLADRPGLDKLGAMQRHFITEACDPLAIAQAHLDYYTKIINDPDSAADVPENVGRLFALFPQFASKLDQLVAAA